jgi:hypothetical protein
VILDVVMEIITSRARILEQAFGGAGFTPWRLVLARTKPHRLKPAPLDVTIAPYAAM